MERRRHTRHGYAALRTAVIRTKTSVARCWLEDLSVAGARIRGGPPLCEGALIEVLIEDTAAAMPVIGRVVRIDAEGVGVSFVHQRAETEDGIQALLLAELERQAARPSAHHP